MISATASATPAGAITARITDMFSLNVLFIGAAYRFTIGHPDTCYTSGIRDTLDEVYAVLQKLMASWAADHQCN